MVVVGVYCCILCFFFFLVHDDGCCCDGRLAGFAVEDVLLDAQRLDVFGDVCRGVEALPLQHLGQRRTDDVKGHEGRQAVDVFGEASEPRVAAEVARQALEGVPLPDVGDLVLEAVDVHDAADPRTQLGTAKGGIHVLCGTRLLHDSVNPNVAVHGAVVRERQLVPIAVTEEVDGANVDVWSTAICVQL
jgi:hypothetical protein